VITRRSNIVPSGPQTSTPVRSTQARELSIQLPRCNALDHIHHLRWCITWRTADKQMHMVRSHCQRFYFPIPSRANLANQLFQPLRYIPSQHLAAVPGNPHEVICQSVDCMGTSSGLHHDPDYSMARSRGPHCGPHVAGRPIQRTKAPAFGGPAFLPAASGGVSSRRFS